MKFLDRIREWAGLSDDDKMQLDRRAFLKGMAVTSAGLFVPGAVVFDMGRVVRPAPPYLGWLREWAGDDVAVKQWMESIGRMSVADASLFAAGDHIMISGTGVKNDGKYVVSQVTSSGLCVTERATR